LEDLHLKDAVIFLTAAGLVIPLVKRLRVSPVLGFLVIGLLIGPNGLGRVAEQYEWLRTLLFTNVEEVSALAELGVVFLLFMIGLELSLERIRSLKHLVVGMGSLQILVTGVLIGAIAWLFGNSVQASVLLGSCLALSSTAIVIQLLIEQGRFGTAVGRGTFSVLLAQDIAVVPVLFLVSMFGTHAGGSVLVELILAIGEALLAVVLILGLGRLVMRPVLRFVGSAESPELFMAVTLLAVIATAAATHAAGLSGALGAFLAGLLLAESEYRHEIEANVEPFKGLLLGLFFMTVGMGIDLAAIASDPLWIPLSIAGLFALKAVNMTLIARLYRYPWSQSVEMGLLLSQGGEFAFVVVGLALGFQLLPASTAQFMLIVVGATMFLTPMMARFARILGERLRARGEGASADQLTMDPALSDHVIIVGFGRTGALLSSLLNQQQVPYVALDLNADRVETLHRQGIPIQLGDASRAHILQKMRLAQARALVVCTDDAADTERVLGVARRVAPDVPRLARSRDNEHAQHLLSVGADRVVPELLESGLQLGQHLLETLGYPPVAARELVDGRRSELGDGMKPVG